MAKKPPTCPLCGSGQVRKSSAIVSQGQMHLQGRTTGLGISSGGALSGQVGTIAATISSDVIERNKLSIVPPGYKASTSGTSAFLLFLIVSPFIFVILVIFISAISDGASLPASLLVSLIVTGGIGGFWIYHWRDTRTPDEKAEESQKFLEMMKAHKDNYDKQWYCFQCGTLFQHPEDIIEN